MISKQIYSNCDKVLFFYEQFNLFVYEIGSILQLLIQRIAQFVLNLFSYHISHNAHAQAIVPYRDTNIIDVDLEQLRLHPLSRSQLINDPTELFDLWVQLLSQQIFSWHLQPKARLSLIHFPPHPTAITYIEPILNPQIIETWEVERSYSAAPSLDESWDTIDMHSSLESIDPNHWSQIQAEDEFTILEKIRAQQHFQGQANLIPHLWQMMENQELSDHTIIDFSQLVSVSSHTSSRDIFLYLLMETYGCPLAEIAIARANLRNLSILTWLDIKQTLLAIAANVQYSHLQALFLELKKPKHKQSMLCGCRIDLDVTDMDEFSELNEIQILNLLEAFRTLPCGTHAKNSIFKMFGPSKPQPLNIMTFNTILHDMELLYKIELLPTVVSPELAQAVQSEYLSKQLAYLELKPGMLFLLPPVENQFRLYYIYNSINKDGLIAYLLAPVCREPNSPIHLIFRGTQWQPSRLHAVASVRRDLDSTGIGKTVFMQYQSLIATMALEYLQSTPTKLIIHGHSLGGVDAQRAALYLAECRMSDPAFKNLTAIELFAHNSPGLEPDVIQRCQNVAQERSFPSFHATYISYHGDPIQNFGGAYLGSSVHSIRRRMIYLSSSTITGPAAHSAKGLCTPASKQFQIHIIEESLELENLLSRTCAVGSSRLLQLMQSIFDFTIMMPSNMLLNLRSNSSVRFQ